PRGTRLSRQLPGRRLPTGGGDLRDAARRRGALPAQPRHLVVQGEESAMKRSVLRPALALACAVLAGPGAAAAQPAKQFPEASEAVPELIEAWKQADSVCRGVPGGDVKVAAA